MRVLVCVCMCAIIGVYVHMYIYRRRRQPARIQTLGPSFPLTIMFILPPAGRGGDGSESRRVGRGHSHLFWSTTLR